MKTDLGLLEFFLGNNVVVESGGYRVSGQLRAVERLATEKHPPIILIIETGRSVTLVRGWSSISPVKNTRREKT